MVALVKDDLTNAKNAFRHALEYPITSHKIIRILADDIVRKYGRSTLHSIFEEIRHEKKN